MINIGAVPKKEKFWERSENWGKVVVMGTIPYVREYYLNHAAAFVLDSCNGLRSVKDIIGNTTTNFCISSEDAERKVMDTLRLLAQAKLIRLEGSCGLGTEKRSLLTHSKSLVFLCAPLFVGWSMTTRCNMKCIHCYIQGGEKYIELPPEKLIEIAEKIGKAHVRGVTLTGGEPLLIKNLFEIMDKLKQFGISQSLESNGYLINENIAKKLCNRCNDVQMSLYGDNATTHDKFTQTPKSFERVLSAAENLNDYGIRVLFNCVIHKNNFDQLDSIVSIACKKGMQIKLNPLFPLGRGKDLSGIMFEPHEYKIVVESIKKIINNYGEDRVISHLPYVYISGNSYMRQNSICLSGISVCRIGPLGEITPCEKLSASELIQGNILNEDLNIVWENSPFFDLLRHIESRVEGKCKSCKYLTMCRGGCRGEAYVRQGNATAEDPICWITGKV